MLTSVYDPHKNNKNRKNNRNNYKRVIRIAQLYLSAVLKMWKVPVINCVVTFNIKNKYGYQFHNVDCNALIFAIWDIDI